ncbi:MAG: hypothetical protein Q7J09_04775 [Methanocalculus sp.]|uniref:hypothetical protein n=1 Tax=Methanocalculus sp. TaxID=2004547 RepID=UPI00271A3ECC|nr:hypothetical protein [Methanocalculus sp.]MDO9539299.1 hypothetical protein [Methanocalculus sp.]
MRKVQYDLTLFPAYTFMKGDSDSSRRAMDEFRSVLSEMGVDPVKKKHKALLAQG